MKEDLKNESADSGLFFQAEFQYKKATIVPTSWYNRCSYFFCNNWTREKRRKYLYPSRENSTCESYPA